MTTEEYNSKAVLEAITANILNTRFEDIDKETIANVKHLVLDMIGCAIGGATLPDIVALVKMVEEWGGKKEATILGYGVKGPAHDVAFVNCLMGRSFDHAILVTAGGGHASETTILSGLALGESLGISGKELITALAVGDDLAARLTSASGSGTPGRIPMRVNSIPETDFGSGFEPWGTVTTMGTAAIAGRLLGLNDTQMKNALGIAVNMISGGSSGLWDGATSFKLSQGSSARAGIMAAKLAKAGWTGIADPFGKKNSYFAVFSKLGIVSSEIMTKDLGKKFLNKIIRVKMYPGGGPTQTTTQAAIEFATKYDIKAEDILEVILRLSPTHAAHFHYLRPYKVGDYPTGDALFSYKYSVANGLARRTGQNKDYTEEAIRNPVVQTVIKRMTVEDLEKPIGFEIQVKKKDGSTLKEYYDIQIGRGPLEQDDMPSKETLKGRFMEQLEFTGQVNKEDAEKIIELVDRLQEIDNVAEIIELAVKK